MLGCPECYGIVSYDNRICGWVCTLCGKEYAARIILLDINEDKMLHEETPKKFQRFMMNLSLDSFIVVCPRCRAPFTKPSNTRVDLGQDPQGDPLIKLTCHNCNFYEFLTNNNEKGVSK